MKKIWIGLIIIAVIILGIFAIYQIPKLSCESKGGKWGMLHMGSTIPSCNSPTPDSGKECTDSSQCESYCQAPEGAEIESEVIGNCYGFEVASCMQEVRDGLADATWCE